MICFQFDHRLVRVDIHLGLGGGNTSSRKSRHRVPLWKRADSWETDLGCFLRDWLPHLVKKRASQLAITSSYQRTSKDVTRFSFFRYTRAYFIILRRNTLRDTGKRYSYMVKWHVSLITRTNNDSK